MHTKPSQAVEEVIPLPPRYRARQIIRQWIEAGRLPDGQPVPSERELCMRLGMGRSAVRSALAMLERDGMIAETGDGPRVRVVRVPKLRAAAQQEQRSSRVLASAVAVLTPHPEPNIRHQQPGWVEQLVQGCIHQLRSNGYDVLAMHPDRVAETGVDRLLVAPPAGVLLPESVETKKDPLPMLERLLRAGIPVVVYGGTPEKVTPFDRVTSDHEAGAYALTRWFLAQGRRRVVMAWPTNAAEHYWYPARRAGYERAMREAGLEPVPTISLPVVPQDQDVTKDFFEFHSRCHIGFLMEWFQPTCRVDAMLCHTDSVVPYVAAAIKFCGYEPGQDVLLAGYDNYALEIDEQPFCPYLPQITMDKLNWEMGQAMVDLLRDRIAERLTAPTVRVVPPKLVEIHKEVNSR